MSEVEVSSSDHQEDVAKIVVTGVPVMFELDRALMNNAACVHEVMGVKPAYGGVNWLIESPNGMNRPVKLLSAGRIPAANR